MVSTPSTAGTEVAADPPGLAEMKQRTRAMWAAGDFPEVARRGLWPVGERIVQRVGIGRGERVLDLAAGTGNAAVRAAQAGGRVVALDLTPELFEAGRRIATDAGVAVEWVEGDAEAIPYPDESFDVVLSTFGVMFAPRHRVAAAEIARVLRPGGRMGLCNWTPEGAQGEFFRALGAHVPPPPPFAQPPLLWGVPDHVRDLFAGTGVALEFERDIVEEELPFDSGREAVDWISTNFGPLMMLRPMLESKGEWAGLSERLAELYDRHLPPEYLTVLGRKG
jgi:ubiquinone/menaquinone biosynthesis C-methylase UbiE